MIEREKKSQETRLTLTFSTRNLGNNKQNKGSVKTSINYTKISSSDSNPKRIRQNRNTLIRILPNFRIPVLKISLKIHLCLFLVQILKP
ncbi:hypothetical protein EUTSA_v10005355mg [Eutrema salsugineum]|uniref:Uncharacterized protein n=1 Tax=Eutrema salsugineum TaxID=72664 RepID=V4KLH9_EUTSA|nr:hypothetical protein EUTSA_v10005355mg [Eutrema salsugineum]